MMLNVNNRTLALGCDAMATVVILRLANSKSNVAGLAKTSRSFACSISALASFAESVVEEITNGAIWIKSSSSCSRGVSNSLFTGASTVAGWGSSFSISAESDCALALRESKQRQAKRIALSS